MALNKMILTREIHAALEKTSELSKKGYFKKEGDSTTYLGREIAKAIDNYIKDGDVKGEHIMPTLQMNLGCKTLEFLPPYATPTPGQTITMGIPVALSNKGPFGTDCFPGGNGQIK